MARDTSKLVTIPGELHSAATGNIVAAAEEVFDYTTNKYQKDINQDVAYIKEDSSVDPIPSFNPQSQTVHLDEQVLSNAQKKQVRKNIGLGNGDIDSTPTAESDNVVRSGGVYASMQELRSTVNPQVGYYTCSTAGNTAAKVIDASGYTLLKGGGLHVNFTEKNTAANATLNIEQTGAKPLYYNGVRVSTNNSWYAGEVMTLFYDGAAFQLNSLPDLDEYDVSARNGGQAFTFEEAVALVPEAYRHGGLKLRFISNSDSSVQSSDNNYVKFFCAAQNFTTDVTKWINVIDEIDKIENKIFDFEIVVPDSSTGYLDAQGRKQSNANCLCSDFISVNNGDVLELKGTYSKDTTMPAVWGYSAADQTTAVKGLLWYWNSNEFVCRFVIDDNTINYIRAFALKSGGLTIKKVSDYTLDNEKTNGVKTVASNSGYLNTTGGNSSLATAVYTNYIKVSVGDIIYYVGKYVKDDTLPAVWGYSDTKNSDAVPILNFEDSNMLVKRVTITDASVKYIRAWGLAESDCYVVKNGFTEASLIESSRLDDVVEKCAENRALITKYKTYGHFANGYINENGVVVSGNENLHRTDYIPVSKGDKVTYVGGYVRGDFPAMYAYDENKNPLRALIQFTGNDLSKSIFIEDSDIAYIVAFSLVTDFSEVWVKVEGLNILGKNKSQIIVDAKGNGDYTSLDDAINNAYDITDTISILVMPGTYSMSAYNTSTRWRESKRNLSIVGVDKNKCIIRNDNGYYKVNPYEDNSTLKIVGNVFLQNLTFVSTADNYTEQDVTYKKAYCLHIDYITDDNSIYEVNNCRFINDHNSCIGIGLKNKFTVKIINCELQSTGGESATIFCHDGENATDQKLIIKDCVIESANSKAIECGIAYGNSYQVTLINNTIDTTNTENSFIKAASVTLSPKCHGNNVASMNM